MVPHIRQWETCRSEVRTKYYSILDRPVHPSIFSSTVGKRAIGFGNHRTHCTYFYFWVSPFHPLSPLQAVCQSLTLPPSRSSTWARRRDMRSERVYSLDPSRLNRNARKVKTRCIQHGPGIELSGLPHHSYCCLSAERLPGRWPAQEVLMFTPIFISMAKKYGRTGRMISRGLCSLYL